ncbi:MAG: HisA/HisF-related TIM barrel protein [Planctomycetota bacterium]|nr:HisA/HisF-related TIM barrel protein [Planctomycetota bacterium]
MDPILPHRLGRVVMFRNASESEPVQVIPVIDLKQGRVVRGVAGARAHYQPVCSQLSRAALPFDVARGFIQEFALREMYVADLDAIGGAPVDERALGEMIRAGSQLLLDAGIDSVDKARQVKAWNQAGASLHRVIVALESLRDSSQMGELLDTLGVDKAIFSLDLKGGRPLVRESWDLASPLEIAERAVGVGFRQIIVLDLADVGMAAGNQSISVCQEIRRRWPDVQLISGGGVRGYSDLAALVKAGCDGALVASALHDGRLRSGDLRMLTQETKSAGCF